MIHMRTGRFRFAAAIGMALAALVIGAGQALASAGCDAVNAGNYNASSGAPTASFNINATFTAGESLNFVFAGGPPGTVWLDDNTAGTQPFVRFAPTSESYTIPASGARSLVVHWSGVNGSITITTTCTPLPPAVTALAPTTGPTTGGASVAITGTDFTGATAVNFGGTAATSFTVNSATSITATSPAGTGTVDVRVTTGGGTSATGPADQFTYAQQAGTVALASSANPAAVGDPVTVTATVSGAGATPTGTVTFTIDGSAGAPVPLAGGTASFTTSSLSVGSHTVVAAYSGDTNFTAASSGTLTQAVAVSIDSVNIGLLQQQISPIIAKTSGQAISGAIDGAIGDAFGGGAEPLSVGPDGFAINFMPQAGSALDEVFAHVDPGETAAPASFEQMWGAWADVRGSFWDGSGAAAGLDGTQLNVTAGISYKLTPDFLVGVVGGYERFSHTDAALAGTLSGGGGSVGSYLGWRLGDDLRLDAALVWSGIAYNAMAGAATGTFTGSRWLVSGGLTGSHELGVFIVEPSARVFALWENQGAWTDSLATAHPAYSFSTGRASAGGKLALPWLTDDGAVITPFAGLFADYGFTGNSSTGIADGLSARVTSGVGFDSGEGATLSLDGELGGLGGNMLSWSARGHVGLAF